MKISKRIASLISLAAVTALPLTAFAGGHDFGVTLPGIALRPGVTSTIHARVFVNDKHTCLNRTILAVHGFAHTADSWEPFADAMFTEHATRHLACRIVAVDLPGHGESSIPAGVTYGDLTLDDYVTGTLGSLDALDARGIHPRSVIGHSMGGLIVEMMQERLLKKGTSLRSRYGIRSAVGLSPSTPAPLPWTFADSGAAAQILGQLVSVDAIRGATFSMSSGTWLSIFFTNKAGELAPGAPLEADLDESGWNVPESLVAGLQLVGAPPMPSRGFVSANAFSPSKHTAFAVIHLSEDAFSLESEDLAAYHYLSGDPSGALFITVDDPEAVHDMHISNPGLLIRLVKDQLFDYPSSMCD